jgi:hypothetical protein
VLLQQLVNGVMLGAVYALIAIGYTLIFGVLGMLHLAHGEVFMVGAFVGLVATKVSGNHAGAGGGYVATGVLGLSSSVSRSVRCAARITWRRWHHWCRTLQETARGTSPRAEGLSSTIALELWELVSCVSSVQVFSWPPRWCHGRRPPLPEPESRGSSGARRRRSDGGRPARRQRPGRRHVDVLRASTRPAPRRLVGLAYNSVHPFISADGDWRWP